MKRIWSGIFLALLFAIQARAETSSFTNLLSQGQACQMRGDATGAFKFFTNAEPLATNCADLCVMARRYCDLMHDTTSAELQKALAKTALACSFRAVKSDPTNATAHLCVAVCYAKNFPFVDTQTKVNWSKAMKSECETGLLLDPTQDIGYYMLGRWNFDVANMNLFTRGLVKIVYGGLPAASNDEAIKDFKKAISYAPNRIIHHAELAKVYQATGQKDLAKKELEKCRELKPVDRDDREAQAKILDH